jgi:hypothetical protein
VTGAWGRRATLFFEWLAHPPATMHPAAPAKQQAAVKMAAARDRIMARTTEV